MWELRTLTGWVYSYQGATSAKLTLITDPIGNYAQINYNGNGQIDEVIDASTNKRLDFAYYSTGEKLLQYVTLYTASAGGGETAAAVVEFTYTNEYLTSVAIDSTTLQTYTYNGSDRLATVSSGGKTVGSFVYDNTDAGRVVQVQTGDGDVGYEYEASGCDGGKGTHLYYHRASGTACASDGDCSGNEYCGGETGAGGSTGICFKVKRCLSFHDSNEHLINSVSAVANGASCPSCVQNQDYGWSSVDGGVIDGDVPANGDGGIMLPLMTSSTDAKGVVTTYERNANGLVTKTVEASGTGDARTTYYFYGNSSFPGLVTEIRRASELKASPSCDASTTTDCKRTIYTYTTGGQIDTMQEVGFTYNSSGTVTSYSYTTDYTYDAKGRVTQIDGPLSGTDDVVDFVYYDEDDDLLRQWYPWQIKRKKDASNYVTTYVLDYSPWGYAQQVTHPSGDITCRVFHEDLGYLSQSRRAGNGQTDCTTGDASDATTSYERDAWGRLTKATRPTGNCVHYEYDSEGRLTHIKKRDDCC